ncbi:MAG: right-handed parallel beta-helix repeat-containing protein [Thaumarchaeota archaeon]|nr:right-handed parallel beta-helix repeat-containing protein [Nitrososphaerota archaeon]
MFVVLTLVASSAQICSAGAESIGCGQTINQSVKLDSDLNCMHSGTDGLKIGANNITLDCAGHTITGPASYYREATGLDGISVTNASGITVKNCHVTYFDNGYVLSNSSNDILVRDKADNNGKYGFAVTSHSGNNRLDNDEAANDGGYGFAVAMDSIGNRILDSLSSGNSEAGFVSLTRSNGTTFENDISYKNMQDGFILSSSSGGSLANNLAQENAYSGFALFGSAGDNLGNNTSRANGMGGYLIVASSGNMLTGNEAERNGQDGFLADSGSADNSISANISDGNSGMGYEDSSLGGGTSSTGNVYGSNTCQANLAGMSSPAGLCVG